MIQTEAHRQFYLGVAGIRLWYAREPLPGAAPSPEFHFPEPGEPVHQAVSGHAPVVAVPAKAKVPKLSSEASRRGAQRIASLQALMGNKAEPAPVIETEKPLPAVKDGRSPEHIAEEGGTAIPELQGRAAPALSLSMGVFTGHGYVLVTRISKEASLRLQETLATNIMKSLGEPQVSAPDWVHWPVFNNRLVPGGSLADLKSVMAQVLGGAADKKVIVLGLEAGSGVERGWLADVIERAPDVVSEHSLAELASNPGLKRLLWQQLKPLAIK